MNQVLDNARAGVREAFLLRSQRVNILLYEPSLWIPNNWILSEHQSCGGRHANERVGVSELIWLSDFRFPASGGRTGFSEDLAGLCLELQGLRQAIVRREVG